MNKFLAAIFALVFFLAHCGLWANLFSAELRTGYFYPSSSVFRDIYHSGGIEYEAQGTIRLYHNLQSWMNFNYFQRSGHSLGLGNKTTIHLYPLSIGLKYDFRLVKKLFLYLGIGPSYSWVSVHNHSHFVKKQISKQAWGGVGKSGFLCFFGNRFFLDFYFDYYYTHISSPHEKGVQTHARNVGGFKTGAGLGVTF